MFTWEEFEVHCTDYLNNHFGDYATFLHQGGADSTVPDILVKTSTGEMFYIEAKQSPAQCGQFVLSPEIETREFIYSAQNATPINESSTLLINYMNNKFDEFREAGTAGRPLDMPNGPDIYADWIIKTYSEKGVRFFITNDFTIFPVKELSNYFDVSAKYRIKRSGSASVGKSKLSLVTNYIKSHNYDITSVRTEKDKLFVTAPKDLHNKRFILSGFEYMFSKRDNEFEIRRLSNTYNANVIFTVVLKDNTTGLSNNDFIQYLK